MKVLPPMLIHRWTKCAFVIGVLLVGTSARSEPEYANVGLKFHFGQIESPFAPLLGDDISLFGLTLNGHFQVADGVLLGGRLPLVHARFDDSTGSSIGNLTLDVNYRLADLNRTTSWLDMSLSLPTASDSGDGFFAAQAMTFFWMPEPGLYAPDTTTLRALYRHQLQGKKARFEFQGGLQYLITQDADDIVRLPLRVGGGILISREVEFVGRFSTYWILSADDGEDDFLHMLEAGLDLSNIGSGNLELLLYYPLDEAYRDRLEAWGITIGFTSAI